MKGNGKTEEQLLDELMELRQRIAELEAAEIARKRAETIQKEHERKLATLISNLPGIAYRCLNDDSRTMEFISAGCKTLTGYPAHDLIANRSRSYSELIHSDDKQMVLDTIQNAVSQRRPFQLVYRIKSAGGENRIVWEQGVGTYSDAEDSFALEGFITDITALKKVEEALEQRTEELESLIQMVAHDLKSPIVTIAGLTRFLNARMRQQSNDDTTRQICNQIGIAGEAIEKFLRDLLDGLAVNHVHSEKETVKIDDVIRDFLAQHRNLIEEEGIVLTIDLKNCCSPVFADQRRILQVLDNLVLNAVKHMGPCSAPEISINAEEGLDNIVVSVSDNGIGIPLEYHSKIFERFFRVPKTRVQGGTGLGLYIVKKIIENQGGRIWVESSEGSGATFRFTLPKISES